MHQNSLELTSIIDINWSTTIYINLTLTSSSVNIFEAEVIIPTNDKTSPDGKMECDHFSDGFEINEEELPKIDKLKQPKLNCRSPTHVFKIANNNKILVMYNNRSTKPTHFLKKPPVTVFLKKSENTQPKKQTKAIGSGTQQHVNEQKSKCLSDHENPPNLFQNCVFHGKIINNFYYAWNNGENEKKTYAVIKI